MQSNFRVDVRGENGAAVVAATGLSVIIRAHQRAEAAGHRLGIVNGSHQVRRLLNLTGVADRLTIVDDLGELLGA